MNTYAKIIYLYFKKQFTIREISELISNELSKYEEFGLNLSNLEKVQLTIGNEYAQTQKLKEVDNMIEGEVPPMMKRSVQVIDTSNGKIYETITKAAFYNNINKYTLTSMLNGLKTNKTTLLKYTPQLENNLK